MKRIITDKLPQDFTYIQGVAYNGLLDVLVEDHVEAPVDAKYVSKMEADGTVTELKKEVGFVLTHDFLGWDNLKAEGK